MAKNIQMIDPDSASEENPLGPKDPTTLAQQLQDAKYTGEVQASRVPRPARYYPDKQG